MHRMRERQTIARRDTSSRDQRDAMRKAQREADAAEEEVVRLEQTISELTKTLADPELYMKTDGASTAARLGEELDRTKTEVGTRYRKVDERHRACGIALECITTNPNVPDHNARRWAIDPVIWIWGGFLVLIMLVLALDLGVLNRKAHVVSVREALTFTLGVLVLASLFDVFVYFAYENHWLGLGQHLDRVDGVVNDGRLAAVKFFTGYIIEVSLSADNVFVIAMIFEHLRVPAKFQHRVLFWGILGALVMRGTMIGLGAQLVSRYHWVLYVFGVFLVYTALKMLWSKADEAADPDEALVMRLVRRVFPVCEDYRESHFLIRDERPLDADTAGRFPRTGGDDGPHLRGRLHPGDFRDHD